MSTPVPRHGGQGIGSEGSVWSATAPATVALRDGLASCRVSSPRDGRYAPSPTGSLHLGNLRTALLAWLFARSAGACFLVRVEDLDVGRVREAFVGQQLGDLARARPRLGRRAVVRQCARRGLYEAAIGRLGAQGLLYPCFCTRAEIREAASRAARRAARGRLPRHVPAAHRRRAGGARARPGGRRRCAWTPSAAAVGFTDRLAGPVRGVVDDFVVRRSDGVHAYNLAVVVDDADQGVGEVVRGADLLDSTPRQLWLAAALGVRAPPSWAHVPLVLGPDGARLAKRHGAVTLADRAAQGQSPGAVRSELAASAGLCAPGERPSPAELVARFDPALLSREPAVYAA